MALIDGKSIYTVVNGHGGPLVGLSAAVRRAVGAAMLGLGALPQTGDWPSASG